MKEKLSELKLDKNNSIVIGSGILQALGIRKSNDIDLVVTEVEYNRLKTEGKLEAHINKYGKEVLTNDLFDIGSSWDVLGKKFEFADFVGDSIIIDEVRYTTLGFIYLVKNSWIKEGTGRPKDMEDLRLIEEYRKTH